MLSLGSVKARKLGTVPQVGISLRSGLSLFFVFSSILFISTSAYAGPTPPKTGVVIPSNVSRPIGSPITYVTTCSDANGYSDISRVFFLVSARNSRKLFFLYYDRVSNKLFLRNDRNTAWMGGYVPGSSKIIENSYGRLDCSKTTVAGISNALVVRWNVTFKKAFSGTVPNNMYLHVSDKTGRNSGWIYKGTLTVTPAVLPGDEPHTITASASFGGSIAPSGAVTVPNASSQTFTITPVTGFGISDVLVDGVSQGTIATYTFTNVVVNHTTSAKFLPLPPSNLQTQRISSTEVKLTWTDNANNIAGWIVQESINGINFTEEALITPVGVDLTATSIITDTLIIGGSGGGTSGGVMVTLNKTFNASDITVGGFPSYKFKNLIPGQTYYFRVGAVQFYDGPGTYWSSPAIEYTIDITGPSLTITSPTEGEVIQ